MDSQNNLNKQILTIKMKIEKDFPELEKYITEMPKYNKNNLAKGVSNADLRSYLDSLNELVKNYSEEHQK